MSFSAGIWPAVWSFIKPYGRPDTQLKNEVLRQQQTQLMQMNIPIACVNVLLSTSIILIVIDSAPFYWALAWYLTVLAYSSLLIVNWKASQGRDLPKRLSGRYMQRVEYNIFLYGVLWGAASFLTAGAEVYEQAVVMIIQVSTYAGLCGVISALPRLTFRFGAPSLVMIIAFNLSISLTLGLILLSLGVILIAALTSGGISMEHQLKQISRSAQEARMSQERLENAINSMSDGFCLRDEKGDLLLANGRYRQLFPNDEEADIVNDFTTNEPTHIGGGRWIIRTAHETPRGGEITIYTDVTALKDRESELIDARAEAEQADEAKSRFLSTMSHELRTPLNIILGFSKLMTQESRIALTKEEIRNYAENICLSGQHLLNLINDIIDYSKIGLDKYLLRCEPTDIRDIVDNAVAISGSFNGEDVQQRIECHVDQKLGQLLIDETAVQRIIMNLLSNALKYSGENSRIIVRSGIISDGRPYISVRDFGPGIPEEEIEKVFEPFHQVGDRSNLHTDGTGLGLTLSRHIARLHGGNLQLKSHKNKGLTALVTFPAQTHLGAPELGANDDLMMSRSQRIA